MKPRELISNLLTSLALESDQTANPLSNATPAQRDILLTLHVLFPNELLPALDLLDRGLVSRLHLAAPPAPGEPAQPALDPPSPPPSHRHLQQKLYLVRSAQAARTSRQHAMPSRSYEVRLHAWTCSCPAFAFAAFPPASPSPRRSPTTVAPAAADEPKRPEHAAALEFGGLGVGGQAPVCKHLLACVLAEWGGAGFAGTVEARRGTAAEIAGWAAGYGD